MVEENTDEWELSKENVQPLRHGRSFAQLSAALKPNTTAIRQQQEHFETEIRTYDGEDPLGIWVKYIGWTEQTFPKGGKDGDLQTLLKNCVIHFKDEPRYQNDPRYVKIWIKFADYTTNPGQLYEYLFNQKIGCQIADFYEAWAIWFERCGNPKMADAVYSKGFELAAQPFDRLQKRHSEFQARVARAAIESMKASSEAMDQEPAELEIQRSRLGSLKPLGKAGQAPVVRIGSDRPVRLPHTATRPQIPGSASVQIYNDENAASCRLPPQNQEFVQVPFPEVVSRENQQRPSKWTDARVKQKGAAVGGSSRQTSQAPFVLHEDADIQQPFITPHKIADGTGILSVRQDPVSSNAFDGVFSNADAPDQKTMYCKEKLFAGVKEFSFEELRAAAWFQKKRLEREFEERLQQEVQRQLQLALQSMNFNQLVPPAGNHSTASQSSDQSHSRTASNGSSSGVFSHSGDAQMEAFHPHQGLFPAQNESTSILENFALNPVAECPAMELGNCDGGTPMMSAFAHPTDPPSARKYTPSATAVAHSAKGESGFSASNAYHDLAARTPDVADVYMATPDTKPVPSTKAGFEPKDASYLTRPSPTVHTKQAMELVRNMFGFDNSIRHVQVDAEFENQFLLDSDENICTTSVQLGQEMQAGKPPTIAIYSDPSPAKFSQPDAKQPAGGIFVYEDPPSLKVLQPPSAFAAFGGAREETGAIFVYEDAPPAKRPNGGLTTGDGGQLAVQKEPVSDKENVVARRALRALSDQDVLPPAPAVERDEGPSAFVPVHLGQHDLRGAGKGTVAESGSRRLTITSEQMVLGTSSRVRFSDEILDEPEDVQMADAADWCIDAFDPASEMTFDPKLSSTRNLTQMVRFAGASGCLGQPQSSLGKPVSDQSSFTPQLQDVQGKTFSAENKSVDAPQKPTNKSSFYFNLDTIQEGNEESKSRGSSMDSRSSSGRPLGAGSSSSGSSGSRSTLHHHLSQSTNCSAMRQSTNGCHSLQVTSSSTAANRQSFGMHTIPDDGTVGTVADVQVFVGESGPGISRADDIQELSFQPDLSVIEEVGKGLADASVYIDQKNPYSATEIQTFLQNLSPPLSSYGNYQQIEGCLPKFVVRCKVRIGDKSYAVKAKLGEGGYARVYHIEKTSAKHDELNAVVAKVQSPACPWEFYITTELHRRLSLSKGDIDISPSIMFIDKAFFYDDGSCFFNQRHCHGTLLDFLNSYRLPKRSIPEWLILYISIELFHIVEQIHKCEVIHGDFKPDNILIVQPRRLNADQTGLDLIRGSTSFLKLIDFGQSIDVTMFPPGTTFTTSTSVAGFQCPEVLSNRPWTYQPDLFGLVATIYVVLAGSYMKLFNVNNEWSTSVIVSRSSKARDIWKQMFQEFLNIPDCDTLPDLPLFRSQLEAIFLEEFSVKAYNNMVTELEAASRTI